MRSFSICIYIRMFAITARTLAIHRSSILRDFDPPTRNPAAFQRQSALPVHFYHFIRGHSSGTVCVTTVEVAHGVYGDWPS